MDLMFFAHMMKILKTSVNLQADAGIGSYGEIIQSYTKKIKPQFRKDFNSYSEIIRLS